MVQITEDTDLDKFSKEFFESLKKDQEAFDAAKAEKASKNPLVDDTLDLIQEEIEKARAIRRRRAAPKDPADTFADD